MTSPITICNTAAGRVGITDNIVAFDDRTVLARQCSLLYVSTRDQMLEDFSWGFAQTVRALALVSDTDTLGYKYRYAMPSDCVKPQIVTDVAGARWSGMNTRDVWDYGYFFRQYGRVNFQIQQDPDNNSRLLILTDIPDAYLWFTLRHENTDSMTALFRSALAWKIGAELALAVRADPDMARMCSDQYDVEVSKAQVRALDGQRDSYMPQSESITARNW